MAFGKSGSKFKPGARPPKGRQESRQGVQPIGKSLKQTLQPKQAPFSPTSAEAQDQETPAAGIPSRPPASLAPAMGPMGKRGRY
jgi:hypothetical protein